MPDEAVRFDDPARDHLRRLERAAIVCEGGLITSEHLTVCSAPAFESAPAAARPPREAQPPARRSAEGEAWAVPDGTDLRVLERAAIERAMQDARYNKSKAAKVLGLSRKQLYVRLRQHGLE